MAELYRELTERERKDFVNYGEAAIRKRWTIPVEPCKCATSEDEYQDPWAWGEFPPLGSADLK